MNTIGIVVLKSKMTPRGLKIIPICENAQLFATLVRSRNFTTLEIEMIQELGFTVKFQEE